MAIQIKHDDDHTLNVLDGAGMTYMSLLVHRLNTALRKSGIADSQKREKVCEDFLFGLSAEFDAGWFEEKGKRFFPKVCFLERAGPTAGENLGAVKVVHIPNEASSWHEYSLGVVADYFEKKETVVPKVRTGSYGE